MDRAVLRILGVATNYRSARALREFERERYFSNWVFLRDFLFRNACSSSGLFSPFKCGF